MDGFTQFVGSLETQMAGHVNVPILLAVFLAMVALRIISPVLDLLNPFGWLVNILHGVKRTLVASPPFENGGPASSVSAPVVGSASLERGPNFFCAITIRGRKGDQTTTISSLAAKRIFVLGSVLAVIWITVNIAEDWSRHRQSSDMRARMQALADAGKDDAVLWIAKHSVKREDTRARDRLAALANKGNAEAVFVQGVLRIWDGDKVAGLQLVQRAANEGVPDAVRYIQQEH